MVDFASKLKKPRLDLNPSSADRWTTCTASPKYIFDNWERIPPQDTNYSQEGTTAHEVAAAMLENRLAKESDSYLCPVPVTPEMRGHAWDYYEYCTSLIEELSVCFVEAKVPLWYMPHRNAKIDFALIQNSGLHVVDYKYGEGIIISPENNLQGMIYARSLVEKEIIPNEGEPRGDWPVTIHIYQPRTRDEAPSHKWETTWEEVKYVSEEKITPIAKTILLESLFPETPGLTFAPSEKACQWCPAKGFCEHRPKELKKDLAMLDQPHRLPPVSAVSMKQLQAVLRYGDDIKKWVDDAQAYALTFMRSGNKVPGFKLVNSRGGNRYWADPAKVAKYLLEDTILRKDEIYTEPKLVGPAQIEKLLGKGQFPKRVFNLISKPPGQPIIVPEDDERESCLIDGAEEFEAIDPESRKVSLDQF